MSRVPVWRAVAVLYVLLVAAAALLAFAAPNAPAGPVTFLPELLTLPAAVPLLPVVYVVGATTWNLTGADSGGPTWVVTVVYTLVFTGVAAANVWVVVRLVDLVGRHRRAPVLPPP